VEPEVRRLILDTVDNLTHERDEAKSRIAELEARLALLDWTPITPENLPKLGRDEVGRWRLMSRTWLVCDVADTPWKGDATAEQYKSLNWTYFRPINPPREGESR
jgi:hypothetical protein